MIEFQIVKNGEVNEISKSLPDALEGMICRIQEEILSDNENVNNYELLCKHGNCSNCLARFPDEQLNKRSRDFHPYLQKLIEEGIFDSKGYLHEINHNLLLFDELEKNKYTLTKGNDNFLDWIKYLDVTEYSLAFCPTCGSIQHFTVEGCDGLISFTCDSCKEVLLDAFRNS